MHPFRRTTIMLSPNPVTRSQVPSCAGSLETTSSLIRIDGPPCGNANEAFMTSFLSMKATDG